MNIATPPKTRMTVPEFLAWADGREGHYELDAGEIVVMSPERARHNVVKMAVYQALNDAVQAARVPCRVFLDGLGVRTAQDSIRIPDVIVHLGTEVDLDSMVLDAPLIVIEVTSPSSSRSDTSVKLVEYFSVPSIRHYPIVMPEKGAVVHHAKSEDGKIASRIASEGEVALTPPGIQVAVAALLGKRETRQ